MFSWPVTTRERIKKHELFKWQSSEDDGYVRTNHLHEPSPEKQQACRQGFTPPPLPPLERRTKSTESSCRTTDLPREPWCNNTKLTQAPS